MRSILWVPMLAAALATGACKKKQDDTGRAANEVKKTVEEAPDDQKPDFTATQDRYATTANERLAQIDLKLHVLQQRTDPKSQEAAAKLEIKRNELSTQVDSTKDRKPSDWDEFTRSLDRSLDSLAKGLNDALQ
jgi:hypothetical protein